MYFRKISMHGFKSFADPVTIEFDRGITCIVGPNGSGKSNISDALRWVLGEQSPKMLRGGKMDEVIFAGTASRRSRGMAEVTLVIDNSDGTLPVDFSEVAVTRRMYRSGESEYFINHSQCRLRDIRELIMDTGIGVDGYSLIGQGKIADIISGKPESRREIFEEAAGIVKYRSKKAETERKLAATNANLQRVNDIISDLEVRIEPLKDEAEKARNYLELSEAYKKTETSVILKNIENAAESNEERRHRMDAAAEQISSEQRKKEQFDREISALQERAGKLDEEDLAERDRMMRFSDEINKWKSELRLAEEKKDSLRSSIHIYENEKKMLAERLQKEFVTREDYRVKQDTRKADLDEIEINLSRKNERFIRDSLSLKENESQMEAERDRLYELGMELSAKAAEITGLKNLTDSLKDRKEQIERGQQDMADQSKSLKEYEEKKEKISDLQSEAQNLQKRSESLKDALIWQQKQISAVSENLERVTAELNGQIASKNALVRLEHSYEGYNGAVRFIMRESDLSGIFGTVGELITVPAGYETAIETALGARMQNIVCRDDTSAEQAVRLLKKHKAGRLTFLPVKSLRTQPRRYDPSLFQQEGFLGLAADRVRIGAEHQKIVEYLLTGVVVVDTLESAVRISKKYGSCRYVTLEGDIVNPAGAITGGAYKKNTGSGFLDRKKRIREMEDSIRKFTEQRKELQASLQSLKAELDPKKNALQRLEQQSRDLEMDLLGVKKEMAAVERSMDEEKSRAERARQECSRIGAELENASSQAAQLAQERAAAARLSDELKASTEQRIAENEERRRQLETLGEEITGIKLAAEALRGELSGTETLMRKTDVSIAELQDDIEEKETAAQRLTQEIAELEKKTAEISERIQKMEASDVFGGGKLEQIRREKEKNSQSVSEVTALREAAERSLFEKKTQYHEMNVKYDNTSEKIDALKDRLWDEFEISWLDAAENIEKITDLSAAAKDSKRLKQKLRELGDVNVSSIAEYESVSNRYEFLDEQRSDLNTAIAALRQIIEETDKKIRSDFRSSFEAVHENFKEIFRELFGGGTAQLTISNPSDPLEAEIDIIAQPPGKKLQNMNLLSGGEKTMTAIALMFAVLKTKPTPFCILDEVEAALDEANIERFADYLRNFENIQFALVTHQKVTMEHADVLYGVTMPEKGISRVLSLKLADADMLNLG